MSFFHRYFSLFSLAFLSVHEPLFLAPAILRNDRQTFDRTLQRIESCLTPKSDGKESITVSGRSECREAEEWLSEKYSGNQNILHLCAGNLSLSNSNGLLINLVLSHLT